MNVIDVTPIEIRDYAISFGWGLVKEATKEGLYILNSPNNDFRQLTFPTDSSASNFKDMAEIAIKKLSIFIQRSDFQIIEEIREINDDVLSLRYFSESKSVNSLPFEEAIEAIEATRQMILSAASSVKSPAIYFPRLSRAEPNELMKKIRFRHTEEGSFILKVSCPIELEFAKGTDLFGDTQNTPYARQTFALVNQSAKELLNAIETDTQEIFVETQTNSERPIISYNFCSALSELYDKERELPFELRFAWSRNSLKKLPIPNFDERIKFSYDIRNKLEQVKNYFKPTSIEITDTFIATVESLNGNLDNEGRIRSGEVRLAILIESSAINAKAILNPTWYEIADKAHMQGGQYVRIKGRLLPGKQLRIVDNITEFELLPNN